MPELTLDEQLFFNEMPRVLPIYEALRESLLCRCPAVIKVDRTQISFRSGYIFACASLRLVAGAPKDALLISFGLDHEVRSPRIAVATEAAPRRWTHHVAVAGPQEIDAELLAWLDEARAFAERKNRRAHK